MLKIVAAVLMALIVAGPLGRPAQAQLNPFSRAGFELSQEDIDLLVAAAQKLYLDESVAVGAMESWSNPASGNAGTVELIGTFEHQGLPCRRLQHDIQVKGAANPFRYIFDRCKTADGAWKLL